MDFDPSDKTTYLSKPAGDVLVCFVGANAFNSELLADYIHEQTGLPCNCMDFDNFKASIDKLSQQTIPIFMDCTDLTDEPWLWSYLNTIHTKEDQDCLIILDRLNPEWRIEHKAIDKGVRGILHDHQDIEVYPRAIRAILDGELWFPRQVLEERLLADRSLVSLKSKEMLEGLTLREREVLALLVSGISNQDIAKQLFISGHTVKTHIYNIYKKINVSSRLQAALWVENNNR